MDSKDALAVFQGKQIRQTWHDNQWYFSAVDVIPVLPDSPTPGPHRGNVRDRASKQPELSPIRAQLKSQSPDGKHPQQTFANTKSHIIRTGTANIPLRHQTALSYETAVPDGSRLAPKNATRERETPAPFAAQESPDDMSDSGGGIRKRPDFGMARSKDPGLERFVRLGGTIVIDSDPIICCPLTELIAKNS